MLKSAGCNHTHLQFCITYKLWCWNSPWPPKFIYSLPPQSSLFYSPQIFKCFILSLTISKLPHPKISRKILKYQWYSIALSAIRWMDCTETLLLHPSCYYSESKNTLPLCTNPSQLQTASETKQNPASPAPRQAPRLTHCFLFVE